MSELDFEKIDDYHRRAKIPGGWLVKTFEDVYMLLNEDCSPESGYAWQVSMCFVPDEYHTWKLEDDDNAEHSPVVEFDDVGEKSYFNPGRDIPFPRPPLQIYRFPDRPEMHMTIVRGDEPRSPVRRFLDRLWQITGW